MLMVNIHSCHPQAAAYAVSGDGHIRTGSLTLQLGWLVYRSRCGRQSLFDLLQVPRAAGAVVLAPAVDGLLASVEGEQSNLLRWLIRLA
jgi:hypothetical protein